MNNTGEKEEQEQNGGRKKVIIFKKNNFVDWDCGSSYKLEQLIGRGSYGQVAMAIQLTTGKRVAIKRMTGIFNDQHDSKRILREIVILKQLKHTGIAKLVDIIVPKDLATFDTIYIVLEYCESDLKKLLKSSLTLEWVHV